MSLESTKDKLGKVNNLLRSWGYEVREVQGCWTRNKGQNQKPPVVSQWTDGEPVGLLNHHFVINLDKPADIGVGNVTYGDSRLSGPKANWYVHTDRIYFIAAGPANHAGDGDNRVLRRALEDKLYDKTGPDNYQGNNFYLGQEAHHPGDLTLWPNGLVDRIVALNAACTIIFGWPENGARSINHKWHTTRKIDLSGSFPGNIQTLTAAEVKKRLTPQQEEDVKLDKEDMDNIRELLRNEFFKLPSNGHPDGFIQPAIRRQVSEAIEEKMPGLVKDAVREILREAGVIPTQGN